MSAFTKAAAAALMAEPAVNGYIDSDNEHIVYHDYVNISVAVATPKGLVVPVIRNAHTMNYIQIEQTLAALGEKVSWGIGKEKRAFFRRQRRLTFRKHRPGPQRRTGH